MQRWAERARRTWLDFVLLLSCAAVPSTGAAAFATAPQPLETVLAGSLDAGKVHPGDVVLLRVAVPWTGPGCLLKPGNIVQGHVMALTRHSKAVPDGKVEISFSSADCNGHPETPQHLELAALIGVSQSPFADPHDGLVESPPLASATGVAIGGSGGGTNGMRSIAAASDRTYVGSPRSQDETVWKPGAKMPTHLLSGDVVAIPRHHLAVGKGVGGATVISGDGRDVKLERGTVLILVSAAALVEATTAAPAATAPAPAAASGVPAGTATPSESASLPPEPPDETEICSGACTAVIPGVASAVPEVQAAVARLPIRSFGYLPHERHRAASFDEETTLTWLDARHLLCTFDPHQLRQRTGLEEDAVRTVRAVLIDPSTRRTERVVDWRVRGEGQYVWRLASGSVLVRMTHELRLLDKELRPLRSIPVHGRIAWIAVSPGGDHLAVGTIHELHSAAEHAELERVLALEPEEQVAVEVFDAKFATVLKTTRSSRSPEPVLADGGELRVREAGQNRWRISHYGWDGMEREVATTRSACRPILSTPEHGLIFAVGCTATGGRWYRMLRGDGHPLLKAESPSDEIEQTALASPAGGVFAVRVVRTGKPMTYGQPFARADLLREVLAVYRCSDGGGVAAVATEDFAPSEEAFALSPDGREIALAGTDAIEFFTLRH